MADRLLALSRMSADICHAEAEADLLLAAGRHLHDLFEADWVGVGLRSADGQRVRLIPLGRGADKLETGTDLPADDLAFSHVAATGEVVRETDVSQAPHRDLAGLASAGMTSAIVVPLRIADYPIGALALARAESKPFSDDDTLLGRQGASFIAAAIKNLRSTAESYRAEADRHKAEMILTRRADELDAMNLLLRKIGGSELRTAIEAVTADFVTLRGIEVCRISAVDKSGSLQVITNAAEHGARFGDAGPVVRATAPDAIAVANGEVACWRRPAESDTEAKSLLQALGLTSVFAMPIMGAVGPIGAIAAGSTGGHRFVTDEHITMAEIVCRRLADLVASADDAAGAPGAHGLWEALNATSEAATPSAAAPSSSSTVSTPA